MKMFNRLSAWVSLCLSFFSPVAAVGKTAEDDPFRWLEEVESEASLKWVRSHNEKTVKELQSNPRYAAIESDIRKITLATDRLAYPTLRRGWFYNFWQDATHVKGIWRRTKPEAYEKTEPNWELLLDFDALAKKENEPWVFKGANCFALNPDRCLLSLSRGGKDAVVIREYDLEKKLFVENGFVLPEAKSNLNWQDADTLLVGTDFGPKSMTLSGYPRQVKVWKRGTPLTEAKLIYEGSEKDVDVSGYTHFRPEGNYSFITRAISFFEAETFLIGPEKNTRLPFPIDADFKGIFKGQLIAMLRNEWKTPNGKTTLRSGALISLAVDKISDAKADSFVKLIYQPDDRSSLSSVSMTKDSLYLSVLHNVIGRVLRTELKGLEWKSEPVAFPDKGNVGLVSVSDFETKIIAQFDSFLVPSSLLIYDEEKPGQTPRVLKKLPDRFAAENLTVDQLEAKSSDGTKIPYFLVHAKNTKFDGQTPTLLYGYGGFEVSQLPFYVQSLGKVWLEKGGAFVLANIRGGGEFGPQWHQAALTVNRQKAFDDFSAIARDLIHRKFTSPAKLAIRGGSNGGLLMGAAFTQHPELYRAVLCEVPLLDMLRYHKLLAGNSWMAEYGDPEDPKMRKVILKYSPYHNLKKGKAYPRVFFLTSTKDDRVHPGHARKMVAKMEALGYPVMYYENIEGGHGGAANLEQAILKSALEYVYLFARLVDGG